MSQSHPGVPPGWLQDILRFLGELAAFVGIIAIGGILGYWLVQPCLSA